jgi:Cu-Zn family superoxide dismutase
MPAGILILDRPETATRTQITHHTGDLPNLQVNDQGVGVLWATTTRITLSPGPLSILDADGSAIIIHVDPDTYCPEGERAGCAGGGRVACGRLSRQ